MSIHVTVAARGVAELSPTPTPFKMAKVASAPVMEEQNACRVKRSKDGLLEVRAHLNGIPKLVSQVIIAHTLWIASGQECLLQYIEQKMNWDIKKL